MKKLNKKGFTLMEMLIVVAIIAVLVAIMIPTFSGILERSRETADIANIRSAYAEAIVSYLNDGKAVTVTVDATQTENGWKYVDNYIGTDVTVNGTTSETGKIMINTTDTTTQFVIAVAADGTVTISRFKTDLINLTEL